MLNIIIKIENLILLIIILLNESQTRKKLTLNAAWPFLEPEMQTTILRIGNSVGCRNNDKPSPKCGFSGGDDDDDDDSARK